MTTLFHPRMADKLRGHLTNTCMLEQPTGVGAAAVYATYATGVPCRQSTTRDGLASPVGLGGFHTMTRTTYFMVTDPAIKSGWRLTDDQTGQQYRVVATTPTDWPLAEITVEAWNT